MLHAGFAPKTSTSGSNLKHVVCLPKQDPIYLKGTFEAHFGNQLADTKLKSRALTAGATSRHRSGIADTGTAHRSTAWPHQRQQPRRRRCRGSGADGGGGSKGGSGAARSFLFFSESDLRKISQRRTRTWAPRRKKCCCVVMTEASF